MAFIDIEYFIHPVKSNALIDFKKEIVGIYVKKLTKEKKLLNYPLLIDNSIISQIKTFRIRGIKRRRCHLFYLTRISSIYFTINFRN